jgi:hypothetical protein
VHAVEEVRLRAPHIVSPTPTRSTDHATTSEFRRGHTRFDFEFEAAAMIGRGGRDIALGEGVIPAFRPYRRKADVAQFVKVMCVPHAPTVAATLHRRARGRGPHPGRVRPPAGVSGRGATRVILMVSGDHLNQWSMDNMSQVLIGKAPRARGSSP